MSVSRPRRLASRLVSPGSPLSASSEMRSKLRRGCSFENYSAQCVAPDEELRERLLGSWGVIGL